MLQLLVLCHSKFNMSTAEEKVWTDLFVRFLLAADFEKAANEKIQLLSKILAAKSLYDDIIRKNSPHLPSKSDAEFTDIMIMHTPMYRPIGPGLYNLAIKDFYSQRRVGTLILDASLSNVVLVKNRSGRLHFPMGKWLGNDDQTDRAARVTFEETGLDIWEDIRKIAGDENNIVNYEMSYPVEEPNGVGRIEFGVTLFVVVNSLEGLTLQPKRRDKIEAKWYPISSFLTNYFCSDVRNEENGIAEALLKVPYPPFTNMRTKMIEQIVKKQ